MDGIQPDIPMELAPAAIRYVCPKDRGALIDRGDSLTCATCAHAYPRVGTVPVLIDDDNSVFATADYLGADSYTGAAYGTFSERSNGLRKLYRRFTHWLSIQNVLLSSFTAQEAVARIRRASPEGRILIIGAGDTDYGAGYGSGDFVYSDVAFGKKVTCIADAHALPFEDGYFDAVIATAVLEHVADPFQCVREIERVLRLGGYVFSDTPFLYPVHMGAHDFTRFTYLGHRRLFRCFDDLESGVTYGPAAVAALSLQHMLLCLSDVGIFRKLARLLGLIAAVPVKQIDRLFRNRRGAYDAAAATHFFGTKRAVPLKDKEILALYRGAQVAAGGRAATKKSAPAARA